MCTRRLFIYFSILISSAQTFYVPGNMGPIDDSFMWGIHLPATKPTRIKTVVPDHSSSIKRMEDLNSGKKEKEVSVAENIWRLAVSDVEDHMAQGTTTPAPLSVNKIWETVVSNANIITKGTQSNSESNKITTTPAPLSANNLLQNVVNANITTKGAKSNSERDTSTATPAPLSANNLLETALASIATKGSKFYSESNNSLWRMAIDDLMDQGKPSLTQADSSSNTMWNLAKAQIVAKGIQNAAGIKDAQSSDSGSLWKSAISPTLWQSAITNLMEQGKPSLFQSNSSSSNMWSLAMAQLVAKGIQNAASVPSSDSGSLWKSAIQNTLWQSAITKLWNKGPGANVPGGPGEETNIAGGPGVGDNVPEVPGEETNIPGGPGVESNILGGHGAGANVPGGPGEETDIPGGFDAETNIPEGHGAGANIPGGPGEETNIPGGPEAGVNVPGGPENEGNVWQSALADLFIKAQNAPKSGNLWQELATQEETTEKPVDSSMWNIWPILASKDEKSTERPVAVSIWKKAALDLLAQDLPPATLPPPSKWSSYFSPDDLANFVKKPKESISKVMAAASLLKSSANWVRYIMPNNVVTPTSDKPVQKPESAWSNFLSADTWFQYGEKAEETEVDSSTYLLSDGWLTLWKSAPPSSEIVEDMKSEEEKSNWYNPFMYSSEETDLSYNEVSPEKSGYWFNPFLDSPSDIQENGSDEPGSNSWYSWYYTKSHNKSVGELADKNIPFCTERKKFLCPNLKDQFKAAVCCNSNWLARGSSLNTGDECMIDLNEMERQCAIRTCYKTPDSLAEGSWNTDGCSYSPDYLLSYESCVMHDLCYVTPGTTKKGCDDAMEDNINKIYCDNVNYKDSYSCSLRSKVGRMANKVLSLTDRYFVLSQDEKETCELQDGFMSGSWKYVLRSVQNIY